MLNTPICGSPAGVPSSPPSLHPSSAFFPCLILSFDFLRSSTIFQHLLPLSIKLKESVIGHSVFFSRLETSWSSYMHRSVVIAAFGPPFPRLPRHVVPFVVHGLKRCHVLHTTALPPPLASTSWADVFSAKAQNDIFEHYIWTCGKSELSNFLRVSILRDSWSIQSVTICITKITVKLPDNFLDIEILSHLHEGEKQVLAGVHIAGTSSAFMRTGPFSSQNSTHRLHRTPNFRKCSFQSWDHSNAMQHLKDFRNLNEHAYRDICPGDETGQQPKGALVGPVQNDSPFPELETILYAPRLWGTLGNAIVSVHANGVIKS